MASDTVKVVHAGVSNVPGTRSNELVAIYRRGIGIFKANWRHVVLPRIAINSEFYFKGFSTNSKLIKDDTV